MPVLNFNSNNVDPNTGFDPIPAGWYEAEIIASEMKATKSGDGHYLELTLEIRGPSYAGRKIWDRLNLDNKNETAVEIAQRTLSQICRATGVLNVGNSEELHGKPMAVKVKVRAETDEYDATNEVKQYKPLADQQLTAPAANGSTGSATPSGGKSAPWAR